MDSVAELEIKQRLAKLSGDERRTISAYLLRLKHSSAEGRDEMTRLMAEMDAGRKTSLTDLERSRVNG